MDKPRSTRPAQEASQILDEQLCFAVHSTLLGLNKVYRRLLKDLGIGDGSRGIVPQYGCTPQGTAVAGGVPGLRYAASGFCGASSSSTLLFSSQRFIESTTACL